MGKIFTFSKILAEYFLSWAVSVLLKKVWSEIMVYAESPTTII